MSGTLLSHGSVQCCSQPLLQSPASTPTLLLQYGTNAELNQTGVEYGFKMLSITQLTYSGSPVITIVNTSEICACRFPFSLRNEGVSEMLM